jgi:hypothetical protein
MYNQFDQAWKSHVDKKNGFFFAKLEYGPQVAESAYYGLCLAYI